MTSRFSSEYLEYIQSEKWRKLCNRLAEKCGHICQKCGKQSWELQGHHLTYERLGYELDRDVQMVCPRCHPKADKERKELKQLKGEQDEMFAWIEKVYGKDYRKHYSIDGCVQHYYRWKAEKDGWRVM